MPRTVSLPALRSALAQNTDKVWVCLLAISHPNMAQPIYLCDNTTDIVSNGNTYLAFPFRAVLPSDETDREPTVKIMVSNIDQTIIDDLRSITSGPTVDVSVVLSDTPNDREYGPVTLKGVGVVYTTTSLELNLQFDSFSGEPLPWLTFTPEYFPGIFSQ